MTDLTLAFDTSGPVGSVSLAREGTPVGSRFLLHQSRHASALIPAISSLLEAQGVGPRDLTGLVVGSGPGSFTGVRVAAATAKGLAATLGIPVWAVSSLLAGAASAGVDVPVEPGTGGRRGAGPADAPIQSARGPEEDGADTAGLGGPLGARGPVVVLFDARGDRLYAAAYDLPENGGAGPAPREIIPPAATTVGGILEHPDLPPDALICGDGAVRHRATLVGAGLRVASPPLGVPTAEGLLRVRAAWPSAPPLEGVGDWEPTYLRGTGARPLAER